MKIQRTEESQPFYMDEHIFFDLLNMGLNRLIDRNKEDHQAICLLNPNSEGYAEEVRRRLENVADTNIRFACLTQLAKDLRQP